MLVRQQRLDLRTVQKLGHELRKHLDVRKPLTVLVKLVGFQTGSSGDSPANQRYNRL